MRRGLAAGMCALCAAVVGCASDGGDADDGGETMPDGNVAAARSYAVVGTDGFRAPAPSCEGEPPATTCDDRLPLGCADDGAHIDFDPDDDSPCPICVEPRSDDPTTCEGWRQRYGEFLADNISQSCINWCEGPADPDCHAWEIENSCGTFAVALNGLIDEETLIFAREFARENCDPACGAAPATEGDLDALDAFDAACQDHQCVLVTYSDPDASL